MKQTAVEWLYNQIYTIQVELEAGNTTLKNKIEQAKEMEKQQIIDAYADGRISVVSGKIISYDMKNFIYLLVTLILTGFTIGIAYLQVNYGGRWYIAFLPLIIMYFCWRAVLATEYYNE